MNEDWRDILQAEPIDLEPRPGFEAELGEGLVDEWHGRPTVPLAQPRAEPPTGQRAHRGWLLAAAAATVVVIGGLVIIARPTDDAEVSSPVADNEPAAVTTPADPTPATTEPESTDVEVVAPPPRAEPPTAGTTATTSAPPTTSISTPSGAIVVPLNPAEPVPLQPIATIEYGPGDQQIEPPGGDRPPPAVWHVGGVLVIEVAPAAGLTGDAVIVQTGPYEALDEAGEQRFIPAAIEVTEPNGTVIDARSLDGGGIVVATVHDDAPSVRVRPYAENPPGLFSQFGEGADLEAVGDGELRIRNDGATWGGEVVIAPNASNPGATRALVTSDPAFGFSSVLRIERPGQLGEPPMVWMLAVEFDEEFTPGSDRPLVEPFGDGAIVAISNSTAPSAEPVVVVLEADGSGSTARLDGWTVADARPEGVLLTRSTPSGLELAALSPPE